MKFLFFLCLFGFCHAVFATYWMLIGNPSNFLINKIHYLNASTGFFVNRSVFATFLFSCRGLGRKIESIFLNVIIKRVEMKKYKLILFQQKTQISQQ